MSDWRELVQAGRFAEAEPLMFADTAGPPEGWPRDPESRGYFYEAWGDAVADVEQAVRLYTQSVNYYSLFASWSTSGGEGTARMMDVNRVSKKVEELKGRQKL